MSQHETKVSNIYDVVDHSLSYDELVEKLNSMTVSLKNKNLKMRNMENEHSFLKTSCDDLMHLLDVLKCSHELNMVHENICETHEKLKENHDFSLKN